MICTPVEPLPMTPTRLPARSTVWSQRAECSTGPAKLSRPSMAGSLGVCRMPVAVTRKSNLPWSPASVRTVHEEPVQVAAVTFAPNRMCGRSR
jgi:hypothetical protein